MWINKFGLHRDNPSQDFAKFRTPISLYRRSLFDMVKSYVLMRVNQRPYG